VSTKDERPDKRLHAIWKGVKSRCNNPNRKSYKYYGGRGIKICEEWDKSYVAFRDWSVANGYQENLTIDRIDTNGHYCPENCRWTTCRVQSNNTRRNHVIEAYGEAHTMAEWARINNISYHTMKTRLRKGLTGEAVVAPVHKARTVTANGETHTLREWAEITGLSYFTIKTRVYHGKTGSDVIKPVEGKDKNGEL